MSLNLNDIADSISKTIPEDIIIQSIVVTPPINNVITARVYLKEKTKTIPIASAVLSSCVDGMMGVDGVMEPVLDLEINADKYNQYKSQLETKKVVNAKDINDINDIYDEKTSHLSLKNFQNPSFKNLQNPWEGKENKLSQYLQTAMDIDKENSEDLIRQYKQSSKIFSKQTHSNVKSKEAVIKEWEDAVNKYNSTFGDCTSKILKKSSLYTPTQTDHKDISETLIVLVSKLLEQDAALKQNAAKSQTNTIFKNSVNTIRPIADKWINKAKQVYNILRN